MERSKSFLTESIALPNKRAIAIIMACLGVTLGLSTAIYYLIFPTKDTETPKRTKKQAIRLSLSHLKEASRILIQSPNYIETSEMMRNDNGESLREIEDIASKEIEDIRNRLTQIFCLFQLETPDGDDYSLSSYHSAQSEIYSVKTHDIEKHPLLKQGYVTAERGLIATGPLHENYQLCPTSVEYAAKVYCIRAACMLLIHGEKRAKDLIWLENVCTNIISHTCESMSFESESIVVAFKDMLVYLHNEKNVFQEIKNELMGSNSFVQECNLYDIVFELMFVKIGQLAAKPPLSALQIPAPLSMKLSTVNSMITAFLNQASNNCKKSNSLIGHAIKMGLQLAPLLSRLFVCPSDQDKLVLETLKFHTMKLLKAVFCESTIRFTTAEELLDDLLVLMKDIFEKEYLTFFTMDPSVSPTSASVCEL